MLRRFFCKLLLVAVVVFCAFSSVLLAQGRSADALEHAIKVQEKHTDALMARPGVVGTAVGLGDDEKPVVIVLLEHGSVIGIPTQLDRVKVKKKVTGRIVAFEDTTNYARPVPIGVSTGHPNITAGTIGCRVKDTEGKVYALSNNHVYADENRASIGDNVLQPGPYDGGVNPDDAIGTLADFEPIVFHPRASNEIDAAIAICDGTLGYATPGDGYGVPSSTTADAYIDMPVQKRGRTTYLTHGTVTMINVATRVHYDSGLAGFVGQIGIEGNDTQFSAGGDSGSLIVTDDDFCYPVGLLFAGSSSVTIANPIDAVLTRFGVTVDDGSGGGTTNSPPTADFSYTKSDPTVDFTDQSTDSDGSIVSWSWDFGDVSGTSTEQNPSYTYPSDGTYTVTLTVTDDDGATGSTSQDVTVSSGGGGGTMHVSTIDMWYSTAGPNYFIYTQVTIVDESDNPVSEATVDVTTTLPDGSASGSGSTGSDGVVTFKLKSRQRGTYTSTVTNVTHASLTYNQGSNVETSETIPVP